MYLVANVSNRDITISDLGVSLGPREALDLHKIKKRGKINKSSDLRIAIKKGIIKVVHQNNKEQPKNISSKEKDYDEGLDKDELMNDLKKMIKEEISGIKSKGTDEQTNGSELFDQLSTIRELLSNAQNKDNSLESSNLSDEIKEIKKALDKITNTSQINISNSENDDDDDDVNEDSLINIHAKAINKMGKNAKTKVAYEEQKKKDQSLLKHIDELENLM